MSESLVQDIRRIAEEEGADPDLAVRVAKQESGFRQDATSRAGARGIMQLMPETARELGVDINDPMQNIRGGTRYLARQLRDFGSPELALAAYNAGPNRLREFLTTGRPLPRETIDYVTSLTGRPPSVASAGVSPEELATLPESLRAGAARSGLLRGEAADIQERVAGMTGARAEEVAGRQARAAETAAAAQRAAVEQYQSQRKLPPEFVPTQETAGDLSALFGLLGVFGTMIGGGGKQNALAAMNAMTGMMNGWRQGRQDLYNRERQVYETNMKQLEQRNNELRRDMQSAMDLAKTDMDASLAKIREISAKMESPILLEQARMGKLQGAMETLNEMQRIKAEIEKHQRTLDAERQRRESQLRETRETAEINRQASNRSFAGPAIDAVIQGQSPEDQARTNALIGRVRIDPVSQRRVGSSYAMLDTTEKVARSVRENPDAVGALAAALANRGAEPVVSVFETISNTFRNLTGTNDPDGSRSAAALQNAAARVAEAEAQFGANFERMMRDPNAYRQQLGPELYNAIRRMNDEQKADLISRTRVMAKDLFSLALEDAVGTGRPTVFLERSLSNLYSQANRPETLIGILQSRAKQAEIGLRSINPQFDPKKQTNYEDRFSVLTQTPQDFMRARQPPAPPLAANIVNVATEGDAEQLPPGTRFRLPDGRTGTRR